MESIQSIDIEARSISIEFKQLFDYIKKSSLVFFDFTESQFDSSQTISLNKKSLVFFMDNPELLVLFISHNPTQQERTICLSISLEDISLNGNQVIIFFKKLQVDVASLKDKAYIRSRFNILNLGFIEKDFNIFQIFQECIKNAFLPMFGQMSKVYLSELELRDKYASSLMQSSKETNVIQNVEKKFRELEFLIQKNLQTSQIPKIDLEFEKEISQFCAECLQNGTSITVLNFPKNISEDKDFVNSLSERVKKWMNQTKVLENIVRDSKIESVNSEICFWGSLKKNWLDLEIQFKKPEVILTVDILKQKKKLGMMTNLETELNLSGNLNEVSNIAKKMEELDFNNIINSQSITDISTEIGNLASKMRKIIEINTYPLNRLKMLLDALNNEFIQKILSILREIKLKTEFENFMGQYKRNRPIIIKWEKEIESIKEAIKVARKAGDIGKHMQSLDLIKKLIPRTDKVKIIRNSHEALKADYARSYKGDVSFSEQLSRIEFPKIEELEKLLDVFDRCDLYDFSEKGEEQFEECCTEYDNSIKKLNKRVAGKIAGLMAEASNNDKIKIFSNFNALIQKSQIKSELMIHQENLLELIDIEIKDLIKKYTSKPAKPQNASFLLKMKLPPRIYQLVWSERIQTTLKKKIEKIKLILGENYMETNSGGNAILNQYNNFSELIRKNIEELKKVIEEKQEIMAPKKEKQERGPEELILTMRRSSEGIGSELFINYNTENRTLIKELKYLTGMNNEFNKSYSKKYMVLVSLKIVYLPSYIAGYVIKESVKSFNTIIPKLNNLNMKLLAGLINKVYKKIANFQGYTWYKEEEIGDDKLTKFSLQLSSAISELEENLDFVVDRNLKIELVLKELLECDATYEKMLEKIKLIQNHVNSLNDKGAQNMKFYVNNLNQTVQQALLDKVTDFVKQWNVEFCTYSPTEKNLAVENELITEPTTHEIKIENQQVFLDPPIEHSKLFWLSHLQSLISNICSLPKIKFKRIADGPGQFDIKDEHFGEVVNLIPKDVLMLAYNSLNQYIDKGEEFVNSWRTYQCLWEINIKKVYELLGENAENWEQVLNEIKLGKKSFNYFNTEKSFGPITISFKIAQKKVNNKYEALHKEILFEFSKNLNVGMKGFAEEITRQRTRIEAVDFKDSENIINTISELKTCRIGLDRWREGIDRFRRGENLLIEQKFTFPENWYEISMLEGEWNRFYQAYKIKQDQFEKEQGNLKAKILKEEEGLLKKVKEIETLWKTKKPYSSNLQPKEAIEVIETLQKQIGENKNSFEKINQAKELLLMPLIDLSVINSIQEDSTSLKELWSEIGRCWQQIDKIMETAVKIANPTKFGQVYDEILEQLNSIPNKFRTFEALVGKKAEIASLKKTNKLLKELKTDAIKETHWEQILKKLVLNKKYKNLLVIDLYKHNILNYEKIIQEIILLAQGELVLENMLKKIKDFWNIEEFILSKYQEKCMLIKGWEDLATKIEDDLAQISSMKLSQHYKIFEEEVKGWNENLVFLQNVLEVWVNVQRKWVYLEGIFFGSSDIAQMMPNEYSKFKSIDNDFVSLMKKTASKLKILDVCLNIPNLQKSLTLLYDSLEKIQKALSEYLETQRQAFARFYFVGDEDLLEIIGNSKEITNVQKFFAKMFSGLNFVENDNAIILNGMRSRENESVNFVKTFKITDTPKINEWLGLLEKQMQQSLSFEYESGLKQWMQLGNSNIRVIVDKFPGQAVLISFESFYTFLIEDCKELKNLQAVIDRLVNVLDFMAEEVLTDLPKLTRAKYEQLITEFVHKRDVTRLILKEGENIKEAFGWSSQMRFYLMTEEKNPEDRLRVKMGNSDFLYGFEYLGITDKLVQTPLTDKCYFTLTQALWLRMGGAPFGPAGTGKTESVKALGNTLGRFVLVFNCDETFNFKAMGRIFIGLCQVGAWGCFDEFNRLEERILSAVSQQILTIQSGLREGSEKINLMSKTVKLNINMGVFVTMNPGYAGRSNLPENLKQLFRQMAMIKPDRELIAQVMLFSQGFKSAEQLSGKVVSLFELCNDQLSSQPHYDFGLRALKSVLNSAGNLKRKAINENKEKANQPIEEMKIILRSFCDTVVPKLISDDSPLLETLIKGVFPEADVPKIEDLKLRDAIYEECLRRNLLMADNFVEKVLQLNQILKLQHGVMLVGPTGCGKSTAWKVLLSSLARVDNLRGESYIIDPKAISKDDLYGKLDNTTMEWTDGIFTHTLRKITDASRVDISKRQWIIFDGDVDPEWAENLNSVLDDNKLLTLPNGERLALPSNIRMMFEVESLKYATLATVSRCGMVWFSDDVVRPGDIFYNYLCRLKLDIFDTEISEQKTFNKTRVLCAKSIEHLFFGKKIDQLIDQKTKNFKGNFKSVICSMLTCVKDKEHVMEFSEIRVLEALFALIRKGFERIVEYNENNPDFPLDETISEKFAINWTILASIWAFTGDLKLQKRSEFFSEMMSIISNSGVNLPTISDTVTLIDYTVDLKTGQWTAWKDRVPDLEIDEGQVTNAELIITTVDTLRHQEVLCSWLLEKRPFIICGPPGSGKTMTLMSTLKSLPNFDMIFVNFSSSTTPGMILKQFEHYCEYIKSNNGVTLRPKQINRNLVVFCDEINLPDEDKYGTQCIITFLRQLTEQRGFWRCSDKIWVTLDKIQFVGACNPPTDAGRHPLAPRFLRHCPLMLVDFPGYQSLTQIYGTFNRAMLKKHPELRDHWKNLTKAMVEFYSQSQKRFTSDQQAHYIYSPRELTRWKYALNEALPGVESMQELIRLWAHEALRLFEDRLLTDDEKDWCQKSLDRISKECFVSVNQKSLNRPILFSTYLTKTYKSVELEDLRNYVKAKLKLFNDEEYSIQLVVFDSVLDHIIRIDRVLRQPIGHLLLVGASGVGKTTLSRFVAWMNSLSVFQIKAGRNFTLADFDANLRDVMKRSGCKNEKICFIFDESNVLSVSFLERMNALLASGEVPGLFEGEEYNMLVNTYRENQAQKRTMNDEEIYTQFTKNVQRNLHVVFTMNPANPDFSNRAASSPAIFNRCVIDWFGDWSEEALYQVSRELTDKVEVPDNSLSKAEDDVKDVLVRLIVKAHNSVRALNDQLKKSAKQFNYLTPRDFLDFIRHFCELHKEKKTLLEEQQYHLNSGLGKLKETEEKVFELDQSLQKYKIDLDKKETEANAKMELIVVEQKTSKEKEEVLNILSNKLRVKKTEIQERKSKVEIDLEKAGPALEEAKKSVDTITSREIKDITVLNNPPQLIKLTMLGVCSLVEGKNLSEWKECQSVMRGKDFTKSIVELDTDTVSEDVKNKVLNNYIRHKDWNLDKIKNAYNAAGLMARWLESQLAYADILKKVDPMRKEIFSLEEGLTSLIQNQKQNETDLADIQKKIETYKTDYADLTSKVQNIKNEMGKVNTKVERSKKLLENLSSEKQRWTESSNGFAEQLSCMTGDVLLSAAFLAYCGFFDQLYRNLLLSSWKELIKKNGMKFRKGLSIQEFLSTPPERMLWQSHRLPNDELCNQNAIIIKRHNRYPLIIDPSEQAIEFILSYLKERKIEKTSFDDNNFIKVLEKSLRFGLPVLIQNVEKIEPILNSVLNKEVVKQGGRILVRVGDQEIDFNSNFCLYMITRNSDAKFTPDLCSRVTFVNFTVTQSSLENQCINLYMKHERPDVEKKRVSLLKLQGEFLLKIRELEDDLLTKISEQSGSILENEPLLKTLDTLKIKANEVMKEMKESDKILKEVDEVTGQYKEVARVSAKIYFTLQSFSLINNFYQFSFQFFMKILLNLLDENEKLKQTSQNDFSLRITIILEQLFVNVYGNLEPAILEKDKILIMLRFCQLRLSNTYQEEFKVLIEPTDLVQTSWGNLLDGKITELQALQLESFGKKKKYNGLYQSLQSDSQQWIKVMQDQDLFDFPIFCTGIDDITKELINIVLLKILKPVKFFEKVSTLLKQTMSNEFMKTSQLDLNTLVTQCECNSPVFLSAAPGFDPAYKIDIVAKQMNKRYEAVAIGSAEGFEQAGKVIDAGIKSGTWVVLKNVHLAISWLKEVEQKIYKAKPHRDFRLFLVSEFSEKLPPTLLRQSSKMIFELPEGIKANVLRILGSVFSSEKFESSPNLRPRLYFQIIWMHAVIMERLRYTPIGWSKAYEFSEADFRVAIEIADTILKKTDPKSQLKALRTIITQNVYGGKIDNEFDLKILKAIVEQFITIEFTSADHYFVKEGDQIIFKNFKAETLKEYISQIEGLTIHESPLWAGLPFSAEEVLKRQRLENLVTKLQLIQDVNEEEIQAIKEEDDHNDSTSQLKWLKDLGERCKAYIQILPKTVTVPDRNERLISDPLFRFVERESTLCSNLLKKVKKNIQDLIDMVEGRLQPLQELKNLAKTIFAGTIPTTWKRYTTPQVNVSVWIQDFKSRLEQINLLVKTEMWQKKGVSMGFMLFPEAFLTASRQFVAQKNRLSLDELELRISLTEESQVDDNSFLVRQIKIEGVNWLPNGLKAEKKISFDLKNVKFTWTKNIASEIRSLKEGEIFVPIYLNSTRANLLVAVKFDIKKAGLSEQLLYQRGIALVVSNL